MRKTIQVNNRPYNVRHKASLERDAHNASTSGLLSMLYQLPSPFVRQFSKSFMSTLSKLAISISSYSLDTSQPSVPSMFIVGMKIKFPSFSTIAMILYMLAISSLVKPMISSDFLVKPKFSRSLSMTPLFFKITYFSVFRWSFNDSGYAQNG